MGKASSIAVTAVTGLSAGDYTGSIVCSAPGASNTPMTVPVTLTLISSTPTIGVNPQSLFFTYYTLGSSPSSQTLSVNNTSGGTLRWAAAAQVTTPLGGSWLSITPGSGSIAVSVNVSGLAPQTTPYTGTIIIPDNGSTDSEGATSPAAPKTVNVSLNVIDGPPPIQASCGPSVPHITGMVGVHWGRTGTLVGQNDVKSYCIVLPDGLPLVKTQSTNRPAVPKGTPYQIDLTATDQAGEFSGNSFYTTLETPSGEIIAEGQYLGGLTMLSTLSTPPGAYLVTVKIRQFIPGTSSAGFILSFATYPAIVAGELQ
jgi:hypothetical protein